jgi:hypothetical protein
MDPLIRDKILLWCHGWEDFIVPQGSDRQPQRSIDTTQGSEDHPLEDAGNGHDLSAMEEFDRDTREINNELVSVGDLVFDQTDGNLYNSNGQRESKRKKNDSEGPSIVKKRKEDPSLPPSRYVKKEKVDIHISKRGHIQEKKYAFKVRILWLLFYHT